MAERMNRIDYLRETKAKKPRNNEEETLQRALVQHLLLKAVPDVWWWHCPNEGSGSKKRGAKLKALGVRPGVFDMNFILADGSFAAIELKAKKGVMSQAQYEFEAFCGAKNIETAVCYGIDSALAVCRAWGVLPPDLD